MDTNCSLESGVRAVEIEDANNSTVLAGRVNANYLNELANRSSYQIDFDDGRGDVKLIIKYDNFGEPAFQTFVASSTLMIRACKP